MEQMVVGVATRKYARSLEPVPDYDRLARDEQERGEPAVRRAHAARAGDLGPAVAARPGSGRADGRRHRVGEHMLVVALGIDSSGKKHALAIREGSTENASLCRSLLSDLVARGVPANRALLVVIDGGTGLRGAVKQVFGEYAVIQRCQVHKKRTCSTTFLTTLGLAWRRC